VDVTGGEFFHGVTVRDRSLTERLHRGESKRRLNLETPKYSVVGSRERAPERTAMTGTLGPQGRGMKCAGGI
jgi:hypothetical protein